MSEKTEITMEKLVSLAKRRGFVFPGSEIYGGLAGTYDYGPLGSLLKENIKQSWLKKFVHGRTDMHLIDAAILMNPKTWEATGHVEEFHDPLVDDVKTNKRYRADHLLEEHGVDHADKLSPEEMTRLIQEKGIKSPDGNELGPVRQFNMMLQTKVGASEDTASTTYLRPETAQGIFVNYKNVLDTMSPKLPFGIAQIGKAFRNEITPRDFIFRVRELEQMEIEYFINAKDWEAQFDYWKDEQLEWLQEIGIDPKALHEYEHPDEARSHYSKRTMDWEFDFPFGTKELTGLAYRTDFDLSRHAEHSKTKLQYTDPQSNETFIPHVIEPTVGLDRALLSVMLSAYREDVVGDEVRVYLDLKPNVAPYKIAVSPLLKNKPELVEKARIIFGKLKARFGNVVWDDNGNIGKRYRRQDEIGTPFCVVVDFETLENPSTGSGQGAGVTVRDRNTTEQERVAEDELESYFAEKLEG
jgi:glycyl-tRNA synthetase